MLDDGVSDLLPLAPHSLDSETLAFLLWLCWASVAVTFALSFTRRSPARPLLTLHLLREASLTPLPREALSVSVTAVVPETRTRSHTVLNERMSPCTSSKLRK